MLAILIMCAIAMQNALAQFPISLPKIPKLKKDKTEQQKQEMPTTEQSRPTKSGADNIYKNTYPTATPIFLKNSIYVKTVVQNTYWKFPKVSDYSSWVPSIRFDHFYNNENKLNYIVEYFNPDGSLWFSEKLEQGNSAADHTVLFKSPSPFGGVLATKSTDGTGIYSFKITDQDSKEILFQGKFKVIKFSRAYRPQEKNKNDFYVEHDWLAPFGVIGFHHSDIEIGGVRVGVDVWLNGLINADDLEARVFYKTQQIASTKEKGSVSDYNERKSEFAAAFTPNTIWKNWHFEWDNFRFDNNGAFNHDSYPNSHYADRNPGDYTIKIYYKEAQIRELNFSVGADGRFVVPGYSKQIFLPYHRIMLPIKIVGTTDKFNPTAWKTDSFYGNPIAGFTSP
jgi:hypothetical protein